MYASKAEAEAAKLTEGKKRLFEVAKDGTTRWVWGNGYTVSTGKTKEVTKEAVAAMLAEFSDDELQALGLTRKKGGKR
jgi:hypothetical protein